MAAHARLSPSSADRFFVCPASVRATEGLPRRSNVFSAEGTVAHDVRADCLDLGLVAHDFIGQKRSADGFEFEVTEEMADYLQPGIDHIWNQPGSLYVEHRVDLSRWMPGQFGTLDAGIAGREIIRINDLKYGAGEAVDVAFNKQLRIYGLGFWDNIARHVTNADRFIFEIDQPRNGGLTQWECSLKDLLGFGEELRDAARRVDSPDAGFQATKKGCQWCAANPRIGGPGCPTLELFNLDLVSQKFDEMDDDAAVGAPPSFMPPSLVTPERRAYILEHSHMVKQWLDALLAQELADGLAGLPTPNRKVVDGDRGDRKWLDEAAAEALLSPVLGDERFTKKLKSPAQAEKVLKPGRKRAGGPKTWEALQRLIHQPPGKPVMASLTDPRPAKQSIHDQFDESDPDDL